MSRWATIVVAIGLPMAMAIAAPQSNESGKLPPGVIAQQGTAQVSLRDIDAYAQKIPERDRPGFFDSPKRIQGVITNMLLQRQLAAEARAAKLERNPDVQLQLQQADDDTLARVELDHYRQSLKLPDFRGLAQEYYLSHKDDYLQRGGVDVKHVLVSTNERSEADAKARIGEVAAAAHEHPDQFDALVEKYSDDPSKKENHGLIEDAASAKMVAPFAQAAAALKKPGDLSPITKTEYGFHVLKLVDRRPDKQLSFEEVHDRLMVNLRNDYIDKQVADHADLLRNNPLETDPDLLFSLRTRFLPQGVTLPEDAAKAVKQEASRPPAKDAKPAH